MIALKQTIILALLALVQSQKLAVVLIEPTTDAPSTAPTSTADPPTVDSTTIAPTSPLTVNTIDPIISEIDAKTESIILPEHTSAREADQNSTESDLSEILPTSESTVPSSRPDDALNNDTSDPNLADNQESSTDVTKDDNFETSGQALNASIAEASSTDESANAQIEISDLEAATDSRSEPSDSGKDDNQNSGQTSSELPSQNTEESVKNDNLEDPGDVSSNDTSEPPSPASSASNIEGSISVVSEQSDSGEVYAEYSDETSSQLPTENTEQGTITDDPEKSTIADEPDDPVEISTKPVGNVGESPDSDSPAVDQKENSGQIELVPGSTPVVSEEPTEESVVAIHGSNEENTQLSPEDATGSTAVQASTEIGNDCNQNENEHHVPAEIQCTLPGSRVADPNSCTSFYICIPTLFGLLNQRVQCPPTFTFDPNLLRCTRDQTPCVGITVPVGCSEPGRIANPLDPNTFYWCIPKPFSGYAQYIAQCPKDNRFDPELVACVQNTNGTNETASIGQTTEGAEQQTGLEEKEREKEEKQRIKEEKVLQKQREKQEKERLKLIERENKLRLKHLEKEEKLRLKEEKIQKKLDQLEETIDQ